MSSAQEMSWPDGSEPRGTGMFGAGKGRLNQWRWPTARPFLLRGGLGSIAVAHFQGVEDMVLNVIGIRFTAGGLDDQPQYVVIQVAVLDTSSRPGG